MKSTARSAAAMGPSRRAAVLREQPHLASCLLPGACLPPGCRQDVKPLGAVQAGLGFLAGFVNMLTFRRACAAVLAHGPFDAWDQWSAAGRWL